MKIRTDHQALKWLHNVKDPSSRLIRWRLRLEEYEYEIEYHKGKVNLAADALSRRVNITQDNTALKNKIADELFGLANQMIESNNDDEPTELSNKQPFELTFGRKAHLPSAIATTTAMSKEEVFRL